MSLSRFALTDRVAIVTGSGKGIGKGIALAFAEVGAHVVTVARTAPEIEQTAKEIRLLGRRALVIPADLAKADQVANVVDKTMKEFGRIDILVNNAGSFFRGRFLELTEEGWDTQIRDTLKIVFLCTHAVAKIMVEQRRGSIINISSIDGLGACPPIPAYGAARAGVINLTQSLGLDWAPYNVRVNCIAPGWIKTETTERKFPVTEEERQRRISLIPLGRQGLPSDIASAAIFFASDASEWITGETLVVRGGPKSVL